MPPRQALVTCAVVLVAAPLARAETLKEFQKKWHSSPNSWERVDLIKALDPAGDGSLEVLTDVLEKQDWYYRDAAIDVLAGAHAPALIAELEKLADKGNQVVAEGVVLAFGRSKNRDRVPFLIEQLKKGSKKWLVQRAAAIALGMIPDKRAVEPLIAAWEECDRFMVWVHILESLEAITHEEKLAEARDWRAWWETVKDHWELKAPDEIDPEEAKSGEVIRTRTRNGTDVELRWRGKGLPLLVLPEYGYEKDYLETYLRNLEDENQILYLSLPNKGKTKR